MPDELTVFEQLAYSTVRIESKKANGDTSVGTGFFFRFKEDENGTHIPAIVTNKHVVHDAERVFFRLTLKSEEGEPLISQHHTFQLIVQGQFTIPHPNPEIDLCIYPIAPLIHRAELEGNKFYYIGLQRDLIPSESDLDEMFGMDEITMVGYPMGIWDEVHNFPVLRRGITATNPKYDWNGRREFLIDCACFPGSSGSPVFLLNVGGYYTRTGMHMGGIRLKFLGILYAGPQYTSEGQIRIVDIPVNQVPIPISSVPSNLGNVLKSELLLDFESVLDA